MKTKASSAGFIFTSWSRCKSFANRHTRRRKASPPPSSSSRRSLISRSKSWPPCMAAFVGEEDDDHRGETKRKKRKQQRVAPQGCFSVYVGAERRRFVIRAECANHPLFKVLLEEAESEYGYSSHGALWLPCKVDVFYRVLKEMEDGFDILHGCAHSKLNGSYHLLSPSRWME